MLLEWPELEKMTREELLDLIHKIRQQYSYAEECVCVYISEMLKVDATADSP